MRLGCKAFHTENERSRTKANCTQNVWKSILLKNTLPSPLTHRTLDIYIGASNHTSHRKPQRPRRNSRKDASHTIAPKRLKSQIRAKQQDRAAQHPHTHALIHTRTHACALSIKLSRSREIKIKAPGSPQGPALCSFPACAPHMASLTI